MFGQTSNAPQPGARDVIVDCGRNPGRAERICLRVDFAEGCDAFVYRRFIGDKRCIRRKGDQPDQVRLQPTTFYLHPKGNVGGKTRPAGPCDRRLFYYLTIC